VCTKRTFGNARVISFKGGVKTEFENTYIDYVSGGKILTYRVRIRTGRAINGVLLSGTNGN